MQNQFPCMIRIPGQQTQYINMALLAGVQFDCKAKSVLVRWTNGSVSKYEDEADFNAWLRACEKLHQLTEQAFSNAGAAQDFWEKYSSPEQDPTK